MRRTIFWSVSFYAAFAALGLIVPSVEWIWPGVLAFTLQIWSSVTLWTFSAATVVVVAIVAAVVDRWKASPRSIAQAIARGLLVDISCLVVIAFIAWNIGMLRGGVIGD